MSGWLWVIFTVLASGGQVMRNAMQKELTATLGTVGATHVRFLYGLPFGCLFLLIVLLVSKTGLPPLSLRWLLWTLVGALTQIAATAMLLAAMRERSFVVTTALIKTEPVHVALFGLVFLGDQLTVPLTVAIVLATAGVLMMSWPRDGARDLLSWRPIALGLAAGAIFGASAIGFRGAIRALDAPNFVVAASTTLAAGLALQTLILSAYLLLADRPTLVALFRAWRPSIKAGFMGAAASQFWFLAFAIETAAKVRTLALIEIFFAGLLTRSLFKQGTSLREIAGMAMIAAGVALLLNL
jgi:drug/metabolite transporter (DMT)-like permease